MPLSACGILVPKPGIKPVTPAVEAQRPNHWTARKGPRNTEQIHQGDSLAGWVVIKPRFHLGCAQ